MLEKPPIDDARLIACLHATYGLAVSEIDFLPRGYDSHAGVYRARGNGQSYFVKVKGDRVNPLSVYLPRYLRAQGIEQVVAPLATITPALWGTVDHFTVLAYPFIDEVETQLADPHWVEFGRVVKAFHTMPLPSDLMEHMPRETFIPSPRHVVMMRELQAAVDHRPHNDRWQSQLAAFWNDHRAELGTIVERAERLGRMMQGRPAEFVLCHADIHTGNLLLDAQGKLYIVDWDQPVFAPAERDLMFVTVGDFVTDEREETLFFQGYGQAEIDPLTMAYYRYERAMEDLAEFAAQVFLIDANDETRQDSVEWFMRLFGPNGSVDVAHRLAHVLNP